MVRPASEGGGGRARARAAARHRDAPRRPGAGGGRWYRDYTGSVRDIATTINQGWFYTGQESIHLGERRGTEPVGFPKRACVVCVQNHDQVGNRAMGDRLHVKVELPAYRAATALLACVP